MSLLNTATQIITKSKKRLGRGYSSGKGGHTVGRGQKGQKSRTGSGMPLWFEGGQLPMIKRMPMMRGKGRFKVLNPTAAISLTDLENLDVKTITLETLKIKKFISAAVKKVKIIKTGKLSKKVNIQGLLVTKGAKKVIEKLGGQITN